MSESDSPTDHTGAPLAPAVWPPAPSNQAPLLPPMPLGVVYVSSAPLSRWVVALLALNIGGELLGAVADPVRSAAGQVAAALVALLQVGLLIVTGVFFLVWTFRCYRNLAAFGAEGLSTTPGWAVGYFFVPILSLYRPYSIFKEIWQASEPAPRAPDPYARRTVAVPSLLLGWWLCWLLNNVLGQIVSRASMEGDTSSTALGVGMAGHAVGILAAALAILVVRRITSRQDLRWRALTGGPRSIP